LTTYVMFYLYLQPNGEAQEVLSLRQGPVRICRVLPNPDPGKCDGKVCRVLRHPQPTACSFTLE